MQFVHAFTSTSPLAQLVECWFLKQRASSWSPHVVIPIIVTVQMYFFSGVAIANDCHQHGMSWQNYTTHCWIKLLSLGRYVYL